MPFLFCGERPSARALRIGATWRKGRLSGATLHMALRALGIDPQAQRYCNVFVCATGDISRWSLYRVRSFQDRGYEVVALGAKVSRVLTLAGIPHLRMIHPAARGRIRQRALYVAHVKEVFTHVGDHHSVPPPHPAHRGGP